MLSFADNLRRVEVLFAQAKKASDYALAQDALALLGLSLLGRMGAPLLLLKAVRKHLSLFVSFSMPQKLDGAFAAFAEQADSERPLLADALWQVLATVNLEDAILLEEKIEFDAVADFSRPFAEALQKTLRELIALDDLGDALELRAEQAAVLCFGKGLLRWTQVLFGNEHRLDVDESSSLVSWFSARGVHASFILIAEKEPLLPCISIEQAQEILRIGEARALVLWALSRHLVQKKDFFELDYEGFWILLEKARLQRTEVVDVFDLWRSLDEQGRI